MKKSELKEIEKILIGFEDESVILEKGKIVNDDDVLFVVTWLTNARLVKLDKYCKSKGYLYYIEPTAFDMSTIGLKILIHKRLD